MARGEALVKQVSTAGPAMAQHSATLGVWFSGPSTIARPSPKVVLGISPRLIIKKSSTDPSHRTAQLGRLRSSPAHIYWHHSILVSYANTHCSCIVENQ